MQCVMGADRDRKRVKGADEDRTRKINQRYARKESPRFVAMRSGEAARMNAIPELVFEDAAGNEPLTPQRSGR